MADIIAFEFYQRLYDRRAYVYIPR